VLHLEIAFLLASVALVELTSLAGSKEPPDFDTCQASALLYISLYISLCISLCIILHS
jgi:hypothetical protein